MAVTVLGSNPKGYRINCCSFQQDAILTFGKFQYVTLYIPRGNVRVTTIGRRRLDTSEWKFIEFDDYLQTKDDGHNIISMGISGDGVIHLAWDMHGDEIHYRKSIPGLSSNEYDASWTSGSFGGVLQALDSDDGAFSFDEITYPRFESLPSGDLLLEFREGRSGLGDCCLYRYATKSSKWIEVARPYIKGVNNNAYLHGFDFRDGKIHVTWTYRDFVDDRTQPNCKGTSQAGPNGPENNHDLHYIYSPDEGITWFNTDDKQLSLPIDIKQPTLAVEIPKYSGIMNQEGQGIDDKGGVHVLGREYGYYYHYYRNPSTKEWGKQKINSHTAKLFGARGKIISLKDDLYALIPMEGNKFQVVKRKIYDQLDGKWDVYWEGDHLDGEPLCDRHADQLAFLQLTTDKKILYIEI